VVQILSLLRSFFQRRRRSRGCALAALALHPWLPSSAPSVPEQESDRLIPGKRVHELLERLGPHLILEFWRGHDRNDLPAGNALLINGNNARTSTANSQVKFIRPADLQSAMERTPLFDVAWVSG
jgi:hypothetical protein